MEAMFLTLRPCWLLGTSSRVRCRALSASGKGIQCERGRWPWAAFDLKCELWLGPGLTISARSIFSLFTPWLLSLPPPCSCPEREPKELSCTKGRWPCPQASFGEFGVG